MARRKNSNEAIESVEPTDIEMDVENEEYDSQENVNEEAEINTEIESTQSSESETEPVENSESENSDSDENPDNSADSVEPENIENVNETENGDNTEEANVEDYKAISRRELIAQKNKNEQERAEKNALREERIMKWEQIRTSRRENRIVYGNLISIETLNNTMIVGVVKFGEYRIIIPASEMFKNDLVDYSTIEDIDDKIKRENQMMSKLLGLEIPFVITQVTGKFDGEYAILASRKLALRRIETYNFKTSKHQKEALVKVGDTVDAVVLSAGFHAVMVNVKGVDTFIQQFQLTHRYVKIVKDMYSTGMTIPVVIKNITYDEKGNVEKLEVSGRDAEIQGFIPKMKNITENSRCLAHITRISHRQDGRVRIHLFIDDFGVPAYAIAARVENTATAPNSGDTVLFQVLRKNEDTGYVAGKIIQTVHKQM